MYSSTLSCNPVSLSSKVSPSYVHQFNSIRVSKCQILLLHFAVLYTCAKCYRSYLVAFYMLQMTHLRYRARDWALWQICQQGFKYCVNYLESQLTRSLCQQNHQPALGFCLSARQLCIVYLWYQYLETFYNIICSFIYVLLFLIFIVQYSNSSVIFSASFYGVRSSK